MDEDPLNRAHQKSISAFKQELEAITNVLNQQLTVLTDFGLALEQRKQHAGRTLFSAPYAVAPNVVDNCAAAVDSKIRGFAGMRQNAEALRLASLEMIDSNKDRQEAAIYAFTIVTIVFLPLSFVSGFMGMNTADIRDMPHRQWVFWAAGIPLTILIILLGLIGAGELGNAWSWCLRMLSGNRSSGGRKGRGGVAEPISYTERVTAGLREDGDEETAAPRRTVQGGLIRRRTLASRR